MTRLSWKGLFVWGVIAFWALPFVPLALWPFAARWLYPAVLPTAWGDRAWTYLLSPGARVLPALLNSLSLALTVSVAAVALGLPAGRALALGRFRGRGLAYWAFLLPAIVPAQAAAYGLQATFLRLDLADRWPGVALAHLVPVLPYVVVTLVGVFANYDDSYEQQARTLGASAWTRFWHVTLPLVLPGVAIAGLYAFLISWSQVLLSLLIGGGAVTTLPMLLLAFIGSGDYALAGALAWVLLAPAFLLVGLATRWAQAPGALGPGGRIA